MRVAIDGTHLYSPSASYPSIAAGLHCLAARLGLPADVPDALLRCLARWPRSQFNFLHVVAARRHIPCTAVPIPCWNFFRVSYRQAREEASVSKSDRKDHHSAWRRNLCPRIALPDPGIRDLARLGTVE